MSNLQGARDKQTGWSRYFDDPIPTGDGGNFEAYAMLASTSWRCHLPRQSASIGKQRWTALILVVERGGPTMLARIGVLWALNRHHVHEFNSDRKPHQWESGS